MADILSITQAIGLVAGFALVVALAFFLKGLYLIRAGEVGVLVKRLGGRKMPAGQIIARHWGIGTQGGALVPGPFWRVPPGGGKRPAHVVQGGREGNATPVGIYGGPLS